MKQINKICVLFFILMSISAVVYSQTPDSLGLPGDNLNLYGVLSLFKNSKNVADFEQKLNTPDNKVNNLDLNHDGQIDYIRVKDYGTNGVHSLVLQDPITATESQDLAIVEIEQQGNENAHIQIVGDEDLYGKNYIIEPQDQQQAQQTPVNDDTYNQGTPSPPAPIVVVNVWAWPSVQFMYGPSYSYWNSPWYWGYYPTWWSPWRPMGYYAYWNGMYPYRAYHRRVYENRIIVAQNVYYGHRQTSVIVHKNIENHVYYGPRMGGKAEAQPGKNNLGPREGKAAQNNPKVVNGPRKEFTGKQPTLNPNQPKQQIAPRQQQFTPKQTQTMSTQQVMPRQQQEMPRQQQAMPRQQGAPHNMGGGGGGHQGGGGGRKR
ncbi:MAG TPA: hypothetical protein VK835_05710 [Bacteroidia bacterium]|nr:hypothetical protein [Bacteroidia bacterium]